MNFLRISGLKELTIFISLRTQKNSQKNSSQGGRDHFMSKIYFRTVKRQVGSSVSRDEFYMEKSANSWRSKFIKDVKVYYFFAVLPVTLSSS
jgi:hypothetical protein